MSALDLFVRKVSAFDFGNGNERESELRRLVAPCRQMDAAALKAFASSNAAALNTIVKLAASAIPPQHAAQLFAVCHVAIGALEQMRPSLKRVTLADILKLQFNLAVQAIAMQQVIEKKKRKKKTTILFFFTFCLIFKFAAAERFVDSQLTTFRESRTAVGSSLSESEIASLSATMYQHASLRSVGKRLPADDAVRALAFLLVAPTLADNAAADARRLVRSAAATSGATPADAARAVHAVLGMFKRPESSTGKKKAIAKQATSDSDENACLPRSTDSTAARAFVCRLFVQKATCVAQAPTKNRLNTVLHDGAIWFASLVKDSSRPAFYGCSPVVLATLAHAIADVALKCADEKQLHATCCDTIDEILRAHSLEAASSSLGQLARQRLSLARSDGAELAVEALGNASQFAAIDDEEFLFEFVLGVEALRGELTRLSRSVPSALLELLDAAIARGAELDRAARRDDGRFVRLAQRRGAPRAEQVVQRTAAVVNQLVSQPTASAQAALSALQTAASTLNAASADAVDVRAQAKLGGTAFNGGVALYNAGRFQESAETLGVAATTLLAVVRAMQETRASATLPLAQVSKAFYMLALAHQRAEHDTEALAALRQALQLHPHLFERSAEADDAALAELRPLIELYCMLEAQCEQFSPIHVFIELGDNVPVSVVAALLELQLAACPSVAAYAGEARTRLFEELIDALDGEMWSARRFAVRGRLAALLHELDDGDALAQLDSALADATPLANNKRKRLSGMEQAVAQLLCWRVILLYAIKEELDEQSLRAALDGVTAAMHEGRSVAALAQQCAELFDSVADLCVVCGRGDLELECRAATVRCWECSAVHDWPTSRAPSAASQVQWATALATRGNRTAAQAVFARVKSFIESSAADAAEDEGGDEDDEVDDAAELAESALFADLRNAMLTQPAHAQAQVARDPAERTSFSSASTAVSYDAERLLALAVAEQTCVHAAEAGAGALGHEASLVPIVRARAAFDGARRAHAHAARRAAPNTLAWTERRAAAMQIEALLALGRGYEGCAAVDEALRCYTKAEEVASQRQCVGHLGVRARVMVARARSLAGATGADAAMPPLDTACMVAAGVRGLETLLLVVDHHCCNDDAESARAALAQLDAVLAALVAQNADMLRDLDAPAPEARAAQDYETWSAAVAMRRVLLKLAATKNADASADDARALVHEYHNGHLSCSDLALLHAAIGASESLRSALALCVGAGDALLLPRVASCAALEHIELGSKRGFEVVPAMLQHLSIGASIRHRALLATLDDSAKMSLSSSCVAVGGGSSSSSCNSSNDDVGELTDAFERMNVGGDERSSADALRAVCSFSGDAALALEALSAKPSRPLPLKLQSWLAPITAAQLAQRWALVTVSVCRERNALVLSRREPGGAVMYIVRRDVMIAPHVAAFEELLRDSHASMVGSEPPESSSASSTTRRKRVDTKSSSDEKAEWWKARRALDERLQALLATIESELFGPWICLLEGASSVAASGDISVAESAAKALRVSDDMSEDLLRRLLDCSASLSVDAMRAALRDIAGSEPGADIERALKLLRAASKSSRRGVAREAVVLVLDDQLQALPLESMPTMRETSASRLPSMALGRALCERAVRSDAPAHFDANKLFYVLNPAGDLKNTQQRFEAFVLEHERWNGHIGNAPSEQVYVDALRERDVVVYMGHNCAERVAAPPAVSKLAGGANAVAWVLGCSSARLERRGAFGVHGSALAYLVAGCPAFVGCLWDVTDGDCDKFSQAALDAWLGGGVPLASAVRQARDKCIMQSLVGAAPVVYGLPHWTCGASSSSERGRAQRTG
jgi:hypothetical protein